MKRWHILIVVAVIELVSAALGFSSWHDFVPHLSGASLALSLHWIWEIHHE